MPFKFNPITNKLDLVQEAVVPPPSGTETLTGNTGIATESGLNINVLGDNTQGLDTTGAGDTLTITALDSTTAQKGVSELATDAESIAGAATTNIVINPSSLKAKLGTQTANSIPYGAGDSSAISWTTALEDGQLVIGATGADPSGANITSTGGTIDITNGANTINLETAATIATTYTENTGSASPAAGNLNVFGENTQGIDASGASDTITITALDASTTQIGVSALASDAESIDGTVSNKTIVPTSLKAKLGSQTANALPYGAGDSSAFSWTSALTDGQIVIGATGADPLPANITSTGGTISIANAANSIDVAVGSSVPTSYPCDFGTAVPAANSLTISGSSANGLLTIGTGATIFFLPLASSTSQIGVTAYAGTAETIAGTVSTKANTPTGLKAKLGTQTAKSMAFGAGDSSAISWTSALTDGQIVVGSTAGNPAAANITSTGGSITVTNGSNTINLEGIDATYITDSGTATASGGALQIIGGTGINTAGATNVVTINAENNGDVVGPPFAADNDFAVFDGTTGKLLTDVGLNEGSFIQSLSSSANLSPLTWDGTSGTQVLDNPFVFFDVNGNFSIAHDGGPIIGINITNLTGPCRIRSTSSAGVSTRQPFIQLNVITGSAFVWGINNPLTNDPLTLTNAASVPSGGTILARFETTGIFTLPLQPAFEAYLNTTITDVTGDGTAYGPVVFDTEVFDQAADFSAGTFTAPFTARFLFNYSVLVVGGTDITALTSSLFTSNRQYDQYESVNIAGTDQVLCQFSMLVDMDAADTAYVIITATDSGGKVDDISGLIGGNIVSVFSGNLQV